MVSYQRKNNQLLGPFCQHGLKREASPFLLAPVFKGLKAPSHEQAGKQACFGPTEVVSYQKQRGWGLML